MTMPRTFGLLILLVCGAALPAGATPIFPMPVAGDDYLRVSVWAEGGRDLYRSGDRLRVSFRTTEPAYVAIVHVSPDGRLDMLYPYSPYESGYVRARLTHSVRGIGSSYWSVRGGDGIGYVYAIASRQPLDFRAFADRYDRRWNFAGYGREIRGDPYYVFDRIADLLVRRDWYGGDYVDDVYVYHVGNRRHRYPRYACYDRYPGSFGYGGYWGTSYYYSCDALLRLLVVHPGYYYSRRPPRGVYLSGPVRSEPRYRFKEPAAGRPIRTGTVIRPEPSTPGALPASERVQTPRVVRPEVERPTLQRRPADRDEPSRREPEARAEPRSSRPAEREQPRAEPAPGETRPQPSTRDDRPEPAAPSRPRVGRPNGVS